MQPFPSTISPFVSKLGRILQPFIGYLQQFTIPPTNIMPISVGTTPFSYVAEEPGNLFIDGAVISVHLLRGSIDLDLTGQKIIPVGVKDTVVISYGVLPTINFIPSYGQNTNG